MLVFPAVTVLLRVYTKIMIMRVFRFTDVSCVIGFVGLDFNVPSITH